MHRGGNKILYPAYCMVEPLLGDPTERQWPNQALNLEKAVLSYLHNDKLPRLPLIVISPQILGIWQSAIYMPAFFMYLHQILTETGIYFV